MADGSNKLLVTQKKSGPDKGNPRRKSTGTVKKNSSGTSSSPNYLRASTGSCHEVCKYGSDNSSPEKAKNPMLKRTTTPSDIQINIGSEVSSEKKKNSTVQLNPSPDVSINSAQQDIKTATPAVRNNTSAVKLKPSLDSNHSLEPPEITKTEIPLLSKKFNVLIRHPSDTKTMNNENIISSPKSCSISKGKPVMASPLSPPAALTGLNGTRKTDIESRDIIGASKTAIRTASLSMQPSESRVVSPYAKKFSSLKLFYPLKDQYRKGKAESKKPIIDMVQIKTLHVVEPPTEDKILECVQSDGNIQISPSHSNLEVLSSQGDEAGEPEYINAEYTDSYDSEESDYAESETDEFGSKINDVVNINEVDTSKGNHKRSPRKGKDSAVTKSNFRRGRRTVLQSENDVPRKLKFRRGRVVENNDNNITNVGRRRFKKREVVDNAYDASPDSEKVVLRHQEILEKKDDQGLFNNVIEKTATKLGGSRNSKVKALVGAFETVISLQDN